MESSTGDCIRTLVLVATTFFALTDARVFVHFGDSKMRTSPIYRRMKFDYANPESYGLSSPFSMPPFESLTPLPSPNNFPPPLSVYPPFLPQPPFQSPPQTVASPLPNPISPSPLSGPQSPSSPNLISPNSPLGPQIPLPPPNPISPSPSPPKYFPLPPIYQPPVALSPPQVPPPPLQVSPPAPQVPPPPLRVSPPAPQVPPTPLQVPPPAPLVPPPPHKKTHYAVWCVAKPTVPDSIVKEALDYACGSGADCKSIQPNGPCFHPNTMFAHASYAFNSYWQKSKKAGGTCDFGGTAMLVTIDPSFDECQFISN